MQRRQVLIVEDDEAVRRGIVDTLQFEGYRTYEAEEGETGLAMALKFELDLLLLDLVLPGMDGLDILGLVREQRPGLPVIILTARGEESDRVKGLRLGADDYVVKPFSIKELIARIDAVLRRSPERPADVHDVSFDGGTIDLDRAEARFKGGGRAELSQREVALLRYLARHAGRAVSREEILTRVWRLDPAGMTTRTIDMHIARLRQKLGDDPAFPHVIVTVRGKGYMFAEPNGGSDAVARGGRTR